MTRGLGRVQRTILFAISTSTALATHEDGMRPIGVRWEEVVTKLFGDQPTESQQHSFARAVRSLHDAGSIEIYDDGVDVRKITVNRPHRQRYLSPCQGPLCIACSYSVRRDSASLWMNQIKEIYAGPDVDSYVEMAEKYGAHYWLDHRGWERNERETNYYMPIRMLGRGRLPEEQVAHDIYQAEQKIMRAERLAAAVEAFKSIR